MPILDGEYQSIRSAQIAEYHMNPYSVYRQGQVPSVNAGLGVNIDFYGPKRGSLVTQESFLQGRGQSLSNSPSCDVVYLPESLFPTPNAYNRMSSCYGADLEPGQTRSLKTCDSLSEVDNTKYTMFPGAWNGNYAGWNNGIPGSNLQTRMVPEDMNHSGCLKTNYGSYDLPNFLTPYH